MKLEDLLAAYELARIDAVGLEAKAAVEKVIGRYEGEAARGVAWGLAAIADDTEDKGAVIESARAIGRYEGEAARGVAWRLANIAGYTKDKGAVIKVAKIMSLDEIVRTVGRYEGEAARVVAWRLAQIADDTEDKGAVMTAYGLVKTSGSRVFDLLTSGDIISIHKEGLAELIDGKSSFGAVVAYVKSDKELPLPTKENITGYGKLVSEYLARAYGLDKGLDNDRLLMLFSVKKSEREGFIKLINRSSEKDRRVYSMVEDAVKMLSDTGDETINDVLSVSNYDDSRIPPIGKNVLTAIESNNPLDYDSRVQMACVYLPRDFNGGIYDYCKDERFTLVKYDINGKTLGSAICYTEGDIFLVDSVEGHRTFRKPKIFDAVYKDLIYRAKGKGCKKIIFSKDGMNETPTRFIEYLDGVGLKKGTIKMSLDTEGYLEADEDGVKGYTASL